MTPFTIADIPKIPAVIKDSLITESPGIPQSAAPAGGMLEMFGENPWDVEARDAAEAEANRRGFAIYPRGHHGGNDDHG
jgi:hypothetical protein